MGIGLRTQARRALLRQMAPAYQQASASQKQQILEEFVSATGYTCKYAQWLLNHVEEVFAPPTTLRRRYGPEVEEALVLIWKTLNRIWISVTCGKSGITELYLWLEPFSTHSHTRSQAKHQCPWLDRIS